MSRERVNFILKKMKGDQHGHNAHPQREAWRPITSHRTQYSMFRGSECSRVFGSTWTHHWGLDILISTASGSNTPEFNNYRVWYPEGLTSRWSFKSFVVESYTGPLYENIICGTLEKDLLTSTETRINKQERRHFNSFITVTQFASGKS